MQPFFVDGKQGRLLCVHHAAHTALPGAPALLHLPAFADEMNKSRRMVALAARALAERGVATLLVDPFGTGDSEGDHGAADWHGWIADATLALEVLRERGHERVGLWGLRAGCLLATDLARRLDAALPLLLWQPVLSGDQFLNQFLRLRVAGAKLRGESPETVKDLRATLQSGEAVEVAGYDLSAGLAEGMASIRLETMPPPAAADALWFEVNAGGTEPGPAAARVVAAWQQAGASIESRGVPGEPFWATQEISLAPALVEQTAAAAGAWFAA